MCACRKPRRGGNVVDWFNLPPAGLGYTARVVAARENSVVAHMNRNPDAVNGRILLIDDTPAIHQDFKKIFGSGLRSAAALFEAEARFFGSAGRNPTLPVFQIDCAFQGQEGVELVRRARAQKRPFGVAFVDMRMPPGWDGIETITRLWGEDPDVQVVICTAHSDYSWMQTREKLGHPDRFIVLKKPFDGIEVLQLAESLTEKWRLARQERRHLRDLEDRIQERNGDLQAMRNIDAQLDAGSRLAAPPERQGDAQIKERHALAHDLKLALRTHELTVNYQPLVEIASRQIVGLEALVRWTHPTRGPIPPGEFISVAEETGLIVPLGEFVLRHVCEQAVRWAQEDVPVVRFAVNLSPVQLERQPIREYIRTILRDTGLQPHQLALEITESTLMTNAHAHAKALQGLREDGVQIEMDDFGTGYSSLSSLKQLPVDTLKIDRSFIRHLDTSDSDQAIVGAIMTMARNLGLHVVAEGVETLAQLQVLARHGCEVAQGFYFSRPLPAAECRELLVQLAQRSSFTDTLRLRMTKGH
jgi:EAL domain-containing protein (putative c-di-GMP-specific phosphodiesterase class I)/CheY-like chemotaxis protein